MKELSGFGSRGGTADSSVRAEALGRDDKSRQGAEPSVGMTNRSGELMRSRQNAMRLGNVQTRPSPAAAILSDTGSDGRSRSFNIPTTGRRLQAHEERSTPGLPTYRMRPAEQRNIIMGTDLRRCLNLRCSSQSSPAHTSTCATRAEENSITSGFTRRSKSL